MSLKKTVSAITILITIGAVTAHSQEVWRIGTFDGSSAEFAGGGATKPVTYAIGRDEPGKSWFAFAPTFFPSGKENAANAPRSIQFEITGNASGNYRLRVSLLIEDPSVPALKLVVNGKTGLFYLHPKL